MYHHIKELMYTVRIGTPDPKFGNMLLEQFGGANGELAAAMQYTVQGWNCEHWARLVVSGEAVSYQIRGPLDLFHTLRRHGGAEAHLEAHKTPPSHASDEGSA